MRSALGTAAAIVLGFTVAWPILDFLMIRQKKAVEAEEASPDKSEAAEELVSSGETINGTANSESLIGTEFADSINGLAGNDSIDGRGGNDTIIGGEGRDTLFGGGGDDNFVFSAAATNGADTIEDFTSTEDDLDLTALVLDQGATTQADLLTASSALKASVLSADFALTAPNENALGVIVVTDGAASDWSDVATVIQAALTLDIAVAANNATLAIMIDNGSDTRLYNYADVNNGYSAGDDLTLIGTISGVQVSAFAAEDFIA